MAQHEVKFSLPKAEVLHTDLEFRVRRNGEAFGRLLISKGAVVWRPKKKSWRGRKLSWGDFDSFMHEYGRPEHRRRVRRRKPRLKLRLRSKRA
jgi:hypothetical protein